MNTAISPYTQILRVVLHSLGSQGARWLYFALVCFLTLMVLGGGVALKWDLGGFIKGGAGFVALSLQITWVFVATVLMRLNHPHVSSTVPAYTRRLRITALGIWLGICVLTGLTALLNGGAWGSFLFVGLLAGVFMLLISTPLRWPVRWFLFIAMVVYAARHTSDIVESSAFPVLMRWRWAVAVLVFTGMAWLVTRMISSRGSFSATVFSHYGKIEISQPGMPAPAALPETSYGPLVAQISNAGRWLQWPWRYAMRMAMATPKPGARSTFARAQFGLGVSLHWAMQLAALVVLIVLGGVLPALYFGGDSTELHGFLKNNAVLIALAGLIISIFPVLALPEALRTQAEAQKLMVLMPGMPQGAEQNRLLASRYMRQALLGWVIAAAVAVALPYRPADALFVGLFYLSAFLMLPLVVSDWSRIQVPNVVSAVQGLLMALWAPGAAYIAVQWLHAPIAAVAAVALALNLVFFYTRWSRIAHYPQAMPAGRLAQ